MKTENYFKRYTVYVFDKNTLFLKDYFNINACFSLDIVKQIAITECIERGYNPIEYNIHIYFINDVGFMADSYKFKMEDFSNETYWLSSDQR